MVNETLNMEQLRVNLKVSITPSTLIQGPLGEHVADIDYYPEQATAGAVTNPQSEVEHPAIDQETENERKDRLERIASRLLLRRQEQPVENRSESHSAVTLASPEPKQAQQGSGPVSARMVSPTLAMIKKWVPSWNNESDVSVGDG